MRSYAFFCEADNALSLLLNYACLYLLCMHSFVDTSPTRAPLLAAALPFPACLAGAVYVAGSDLWVSVQPETFLYFTCV